MIGILLTLPFVVIIAIIVAVIVIIIILLTYIGAVATMALAGASVIFGAAEGPTMAEKHIIWLHKNRKQLGEVIGQESPPRLTFDQLDTHVKYVSRSGAISIAPHIGQFKLQLGEIQFLTQVLDSADDHAIVVYAGSAPGVKTPHVGAMFPNVKFLLVDPNRHILMRHGRPVHPRNLTGKAPAEIVRAVKTGRDQYYVVQDLFRDELAAAFAGTPAYFISDIRTGGENTQVGKRGPKTDYLAATEHADNAVPGDYDIMFNSAQMLVWLKLMQPIAAMLKFRSPFFNDAAAAGRKFDEDAFESARNYGLDFAANYRNGEFYYLAPDVINLQAWPGQISTETRLIVSAANNPNYGTFHKFIPTEWDDKFYYYNKFIRQYEFHHHCCLDRELGLDGCNDCAITVEIYRQYYAKFEPGLAGDQLTQKIKGEIRDSLANLHKRLKVEHGHGYFFEPYVNVDELFQMAEARVEKYAKFNQIRDKPAR